MAAMSGPIYHLVPAEYFYSLPPDQPYLPRQFADDGFIHCTAPAELVPLVANKFLREIPGDFLALTIDPERVRAPVKWEPGSAPPGYSQPEGTEATLFPHIY